MNSEQEPTLKNFERIEAYLLGTMDEVERNQFEKERRDNPDFEKLVISQTEWLRSVEIGAMRSHLHKIHGQQAIKNPTKLRFWLAAAAGICLLLASAIWWQMQENEFGELFVAYQSVDPGLPVPMSASESGTYHFYDAMVDYKLENYALAFSKWDSLLKREPGNDSIQFYMGLALFNQKAYAESLPYFTKVERNNASVFQYKSQWYQVLVALAEENRSRILDVKPLQDSPYADKIHAIQVELGE